MDGNEYASIMTDKNRRQTFCDGGEEEFLRLASLHMRWLSSSHSALTKERDEALAKLAAMESQKPVATLREWTENGCSADYFDIHEHIPVGSDLYLGPVPAAKPAVAVPDGWHIGDSYSEDTDRPAEANIHIGARHARIQCYADTEAEAVALRDFIYSICAAPSHSQQSDAVDLLRQIFELYEDGVDCYENPDEGAGYLGKAFRIDDDTYKLCVELLDSSEDRCPSHESEQE